ncbi:phosphatidylserine/phosphatidylglycerophosphate/cardiolipin synthase-like enzyme [Kibdelosporangium banguiense]|uniref:phospholipase D n=1 Tax=Kibdelosporangium banguiense TaxID=1365924 RepID=A0ABS4TE84_9PSEU|nr:phospholipase D-like domain-containing protein [Kibdelosporangium banguiense]MBP2322723.1 phosphatidylserine/phosphatidylglycerophosphate/cardiolipin synthase-like enzyme [Kibdelosporangium banguiense]
MRFGKLLTGLLTVVALVVPVPSAAAAVTSGAIFNDPTVPAKQQVIVNHIRSLIQGAAVGSSIRVAIYHFSDANVAADLVAAHNRGVDVRMVQDYSDSATAASKTVKTALGSRVTVCTQDRACIGDYKSPIMHNKFFLFSNTSGSTNVVVQSSANLNAGNSTKLWNNAVTLVGNAALYTSYDKYFNDLAAKKKDNDYYRSENAGNTKTYFFPRAGSDESTDTIYNMLNENVTCEGNTSTGTETGRTIIRIAMWYFSRDDIARKLRQLADQKCWIEIVYTTLDDGSRGHLTGHDRIVLYQISGNYEVHSKYMLIEGTYAGKKDTKWVMTGSHNYTSSALRENDEALLRIESGPIHDQYRANFWALRAAGS